MQRLIEKMKLRTRRKRAFSRVSIGGQFQYRVFWSWTLCRIGPCDWSAVFKMAVVLMRCLVGRRKGGFCFVFPFSGAIRRLSKGGPLGAAVCILLIGNARTIRMHVKRVTSRRGCPRERGSFLILSKCLFVESDGSRSAVGEWHFPEQNGQYITSIPSGTMSGLGESSITRGWSSAVWVVRCSALRLGHFTGVICDVSLFCGNYIKMTMSCPEVMYQAYYPYLYQRASTGAGVPRPTFPSPFTHQYDRVSNVYKSNSLILTVYISSLICNRR